MLMWLIISVYIFSKKSEKVDFYSVSPFSSAFSSSDVSPFSGFSLVLSVQTPDRRG